MYISEQTGPNNLDQPEVAGRHSCYTRLSCKGAQVQPPGTMTDLPQ